MTLAAVVCCTIFVLAQDTQKDRNRTYNITLGNVQYAHHDEKMSAGEAVGKILTGALTGKVSVEATKYEEDVKSAIIKGLSSAYRFRFNDALLRVGDVVEEGNLVCDALITNINAKSDSQTYKDKEGDTHVNTWYLIGKPLRVLCDGPSKNNPALLSGRTEGNKIAFFEGDEQTTGRFLTFVADRADAYALYGSIREERT